MTTPTVFAPPPGKMSNRKFIERLVSWGARVSKTRGEDTILVMPDGCKKTVRSEQCHQGNSAKTCLELVTDCLGIEWATFATTLPRPYTEREKESLADIIRSNRLDKMRSDKDWADLQWRELPIFLREALHEDALNEQKERDLAEVRERRRQEKMAMREAQAQAAAVPAQPVLATVPEQDAVSDEAEERIKAKRNKGHVNLVFDALVEARVPLSISKIAEMTDLTRNQAGQAAVHLTNSGNILRVKQGVYKAKDQYVPQEVHLTMDQQAASPLTFDDRFGGMPMVEQDVQNGTLAPSPQVLAERVERRPILDEDVANDILDLLFPQGFKARHLPAIERWKAATEYLIHEVQGG